MTAVTVFGGTGFLGYRIVKQLAGAGASVRVAVRHPERIRSKLSGADTGPVAVFAADVRDQRSAADAVAGADSVINAVSAYVEKGGVTYTAVHVQGALHVAEACSLQKISRLVHISGIGADPISGSTYIRARGQGEQKVRQAFPRATVLRPSVMFAHDEGFLHALLGLARASPVIPLIGSGRTRLQPIHAYDVAAAACAALRDSEAPGTTYEIAGNESFTLKEIAEMILARLGRRRILLSVPFSLADPLAFLLERLPNAPLTTAQVDLLKGDNVPTPELPGIARLGITPQSIRDVISNMVAG